MHDKQKNQLISAAVSCQTLWTYKDCADFLKVSADKLRHDMAAGRIPSHLFVRPFGGRAVRFLPDAVMAYARGE